MKGKEIWIIEYKEEDENGIDFITKLVHLSSSKENAIKWIKNNSDYSGDENNWWWTIYKLTVDEEDTIDNIFSNMNLEVYDRYGIKSDYQPQNYIPQTN